MTYKLFRNLFKSTRVRGSVLSPAAVPPRKVYVKPALEVIPTACQPLAASASGVQVILYGIDSYDYYEGPDCAIKDAQYPDCEFLKVLPNWNWTWMKEVFWQKNSTDYRSAGTKNCNSKGHNPLDGAVIFKGEGGTWDAADFFQNAQFDDCSGDPIHFSGTYNGIPFTGKVVKF